MHIRGAIKRFPQWLQEDDTAVSKMSVESFAIS